MRGEAVPQRMNADTLGDAGTPRCQANDPMQLARTVLSALAPGGGYQSSWGTLLLVLGGMNRDAVPGMSINGHQATV